MTVTEIEQLADAISRRIADEIIRHLDNQFDPTIKIDNVDLEGEGDRIISALTEVIKEAVEVIKEAVDGDKAG